MRLRLVLAVLLLALLCGRVAAHLMPQGQGAVRFDDAGVFAMVAMPVDAFLPPGAAAGRRMGKAEFEASRDALQRQLPSLLAFRRGDAPGRVLVSQLMLPGTHELGDRPDTDHFVAMLRVVWDAGSAGEVTLAAPWLERTGAPLWLQATRGADAEAVALTPHYTQHRFFAGAAASFSRFVALGAEHILLGADHLLFLLTVLVVGAGWRYWAAVVTSFTLAHSVTLTLGALGWVTVPASIAEPLIAASIVLMAWLNLRGGATRLAQRSAIVFACGLVHGMGFARALGELGGTGARWLQLAGFNLGVELGQLLFVAAALAVLALVRRAAPALRVAQAMSWCAVVLGAGLFASLFA